MATYCLPRTFFPPNFTVQFVRQGGEKLTYCPFKYQRARTRLDGQMDGQMDGQTESNGHVRGGAALGRREGEHLPAGLRSSRGFCESGSPPTATAVPTGSEGPSPEKRL